MLMDFAAISPLSERRAPRVPVRWSVEGSGGKFRKKMCSLMHIIVGSPAAMLGDGVLQIPLLSLERCPLFRGSFVG